MSRPQRHDVDYFPFYIKDGRTLHVLESKYKGAGTGFFTNLFRFLSGRPDHHFCMEDMGDQLWFFSRTFVDEEEGFDMINLMVKTGKLDRDLWEQKKVIASHDFLESLKKAYEKRRNECITIDEIRELYGVNGTRNPQGDEFPVLETPPQEDNFPLSGGINPQSKVKKSKEKKKRYLSYVLLLENEYKKLCDDFEKTIIDSKIEDLDNYIGQKPESRTKKYSDHNRVLRAWLKRDGITKKGEKREEYKPRENPEVCRECKQPASSIISGRCPKCRGE